MGGDEDELRNRIRKVEEESAALPRKIIDTKEFKSKREKVVMGEEKYMWACKWWKVDV